MVALWERLCKTVALHHVEAHTGKGDALSLGNAKADELATAATGGAGSCLTTMATAAAGGLSTSGHLSTAATGGSGAITSGISVEERFNQLANRLSTEPKHNDAPRTMLRFDPYSTPNILSLL